MRTKKLRYFVLVQFYDPNKLIGRSQYSVGPEDAWVAVRLPSVYTQKGFLVLQELLTQLRQYAPYLEVSSGSINTWHETTTGKWRYRVSKR